MGNEGVEYAAIAKACGLKGIKVTSPAQLRGIVQSHRWADESQRTHIHRGPAQSGTWRAFPQGCHEGTSATCRDQEGGHASLNIVQFPARRSNTCRTAVFF